MPRIKVKRTSTIVDMTAMCDVSFLLLTFFILTAKFRPSQPVVIDIPSARTEKITPDNLMTISVDKEGKVYYSVSNPKVKSETLTNLIQRYGDKYPSLKTLNQKQINNFGNIEMMGFDINQLPQVLNLPADDIGRLTAKDFSGIPIDSANNQLADWIQSGRWADQIDRKETGADREEIRIAIKGDKDSNIKAVQDVIKIITSDPVNINRFNLITTLEGPLGTADAPAATTN